MPTDSKLMLTEGQLEVLREVCRGNADALAFCEVLVAWLHWIDDVVDRDRQWTHEQTLQVNLRLLLTVAENPFFQQHKAALLALTAQAFRAYLDSEHFSRRQDVRDRRAADVLKSFYHEIVWHVADLVGGWDHAREMTRQHRAFDYDCGE